MNLHELPRYHLKVVRLPIPPPGLVGSLYSPRTVCRDVVIGDQFYESVTPIGYIYGYRASQTLVEVSEEQRVGFAKVMREASLGLRRRTTA